MNKMRCEIPQRMPPRVNDSVGENESEENPANPPSQALTFTIRHLKQGATGAVKTWPAAPVLLDYLVRRGGLRGVNDKSFPTTNGDIDALDLTCPPSPLELNLIPSTQDSDLSPESKQPYNIVELGGGTGFLSIGLALALNDMNGDYATHQTRVRLVCTDNDRATIKNMRHNISRQSSDTNVTKTVKIEPLDWGSEVGVQKFSKVLRSHFKKKAKGQKGQEESPEDVEDPITLLSHLIASDVHYGETTLEPLSTVVAAIKLRNPNIAVILLLKERSPKYCIANLKMQIEAKVKSGLELKHESMKSELDKFSVHLRDVIHEELPHMKIIEC
jgi:hypothetical protein